MSSKIATRKVGKTFRQPGKAGVEVQAIDSISLSVREGEFLSIVGPSGCGKSTLFNILTGLIPPSSGEVLLDGEPTTELLGRVGYMPQKDLLMPWRSVIDNVILGQELQGVSRERARTRARAEFPRFGLQGFEDHWPAQLSGGMRQRAALLRTLLTDREILLLDEPFGALDALTRQGMQGWLLDIWSAESKTIILITHDVEEAVFLSDRIVVLTGRPGRVATEVTVDLPRPRTLEMHTSAAFVALKQEVLRPLHDAIEQAWKPGEPEAAEPREVR